MSEIKYSSEKELHKNENRVEFIDVLKFLGIFAIYLGHFGAGAGYAYLFVYTYHVPLFFFISGCMATFEKRSKTVDYIQNKVRTILVPWFLFAVASITFFAVNSNAGYSILKKYMILVMQGTVRNNFFAPSLWFLTCLFVVSILFFFIKKTNNKLLMLLISLVLFFIAEKILPNRPSTSPTMWFNVDSALYYCVYYCLGFVLFPSIRLLFESKKMKDKLFISITFAFSLSYSVLLFFGRDTLSFLNHLGALSIFTPILKVLVLIWLNVLIANIFGKVKILKKYGINTLYLCGSEYIMKALIPIVLSMIGLSFSVVTPIAAFVYTLILLNLIVNYLVPVEKYLIDLINIRSFKWITGNNVTE